MAVTSGWARTGAPRSLASVLARLLLGHGSARAEGEDGEARGVLVLASRRVAPGWFGSIAHRFSLWLPLRFSFSLIFVLFPFFPSFFFRFRFRCRGPGRCRW